MVCVVDCSIQYNTTGIAGNRVQVPADACKPHASFTGGLEKLAICGLARTEA
jgi:hypothetical protein